MSVEEIRAFIIYLVSEWWVSASMQNPALHVVLFLYRHVLQVDIDLPANIHSC